MLAINGAGGASVRSKKGASECRRAAVRLRGGAVSANQRPSGMATMGDKGEADRAERLRAALRENLKRRKAQARGRKAQEGDTDDAAGGGAPAADPASGAGEER